MSLRLFNTARTRHSLFAFLRIRKYASFSDTVTLEASQIQSSSVLLAGIQSLRLRTNNTWPSWQSIKDDHSYGDEQLFEDERNCKTELLSILSAIKSYGNIKETTLPLFDILDLPIQHTKTKTNEEGIDTEANASSPRTPITILNAIGLDCTCPDLGLWTLDSFPNIYISDPETRRALLRLRSFPTEDAWHEFVSRSKDPVLQAFDYTASFHSRDFTRSEELAGTKTWIDLGAIGCGYYALRNVDIDEFGATHFADDMAKNAEYLASPEGKDVWQPCLYEARREKGDGFVSSKLTEDIKRNEAASVVFDRPVWQLPDSIRNMIAAQLTLEDDEELEWLEYRVRKKKKDKES